MTALGLGTLAGCQAPKKMTEGPTPNSTTTPNETQTEETASGMGFRGTFTLSKDKPFEPIKFRAQDTAQYNIEISISDKVVTESSATADACILTQRAYENYKQKIKGGSKSTPTEVDTLVCKEVTKSTHLKGQLNPGKYVLVIDATRRLESDSKIDKGELAVTVEGTVDWETRA